MKACYTLLFKELLTLLSVTKRDARARARTRFYRRMQLDILLNLQNCISETFTYALRELREL